MQVIRATTYRRMPWKNGGGETAEIAIAPTGARLEDFDWRISMARVDGDGPFSVFDGVDRTLTILTGAGMQLDIAGQGRRELSPESEPFAFAADVATTATLLSGSITDLNVMTRRGRATHRVVRHVIDRELTISPCAQHTFIVCAAGSVRVASTRGAIDLAEMDTLCVDAGGPALRLDAAGRSVVLAIAVDAAAAGTRRARDP